MKFLHFTFFYIFFISQVAIAQDSPRKYLDEAIAVMKQNSVNKGKIDWENLSKVAIDSLGTKKKR